MATVVLPRSLVALVPAAERRAEVTGETVSEVLVALDRRWPGLLDRICDPGPVLRRHLNLYVDGERAKLTTPVAPASTVHVIPAVSGGTAARQEGGRQEQCRRQEQRRRPEPRTVAD